MVVTVFNHLLLVRPLTTQAVVQVLAQPPQVLAGKAVAQTESQAQERATQELLTPEAVVVEATVVLAATVVKAL
jgi:hypothetical protein